MTRKPQQRLRQGWLRQVSAKMKLLCIRATTCTFPAPSAPRQHVSNDQDSNRPKSVKARYCQSKSALLRSPPTATAEACAAAAATMPAAAATSEACTTTTAETGGAPTAAAATAGNGPPQRKRLLRLISQGLVHETRSLAGPSIAGASGAGRSAASAALPAVGARALERSCKLSLLLPPSTQLLGLVPQALLHGLVLLVVRLCATAACALATPGLAATAIGVLQARQAVRWGTLRRRCKSGPRAAQLHVWPLGMAPGRQRRHQSESRQGAKHRCSQHTGGKLAE